jgi:hypothetical protein
MVPSLRLRAWRGHMRLPLATLVHSIRHAEPFLARGYATSGLARGDLQKNS